MDIVKVRALTDTELGGELVTHRRHLYDLRFQLATRQLTDHSQLTQTRRTIARVLTVMTERGLDERDVARLQPVVAKPTARGRSRLRGGSGSESKPAASKTATGGKKE